MRIIVVVVGVVVYISLVFVLFYVNTISQNIRQLWYAFFIVFFGSPHAILHIYITCKPYNSNWVISFALSHSHCIHCFWYCKHIEWSTKHSMFLFCIEWKSKQYKNIQINSLQYHTLNRNIHYFLKMGEVAIHV